MTQVENYFIQRKKGRPIRRLAKKLILPSFSAPCGQTMGALYTKGQLNTISVGGFQPSIDFSSMFTAEFFVKINAISSGDPTFILDYHSVLDDTEHQFMFTIDAGKLVLSMTTSSGEETLISDDFFPLSSWVSVAATFDGTDAVLYINGRRQETELTLVGTINQSGNGIYEIYFGVNTALSVQGFLGGLDELRLWSAVRDSSELETLYKVYVSPDASGLELYWNFNNGNSTGTGLGFNEDLVTAGALLWDEDFWEVTNDAPELGIGCSFVAAQALVTIPSTGSLKYPITPPLDNNFGLIVRWIDSEGVLQRRLLFNTSDDMLMISPFPERYVGEILPSNFYIEIWSHPYKSTVDLEDAMELLISLTTHPTTSFDVSSATHETLVVDENLAEEFPLANSPYEFDSPLTFE